MRLPSGADLSRDLSSMLGGIQVWVEVFPEGRQSHPDRSAPLELGASNGSPAWVPRRIQQEGRLILWLPLSFVGEHRGFLAVAIGPEQGKALGIQRIESTLLVVALHLFHLMLERELDERVQSRDEFLAIASHELKTPLTAIYGLVQLQERLLKTRVWPGDVDELRKEQERYLSFVRTTLRQIERLAELTNMLLDLSRIQAGRFGVEVVPLDAARALRELVEGRLQILAEEAGVDLKLDAPERLSGRLDPLRFDELVTNLAMQGIRVSPEGGEVRIELGTRKGEFYLRVSDQGLSVPEQERRKAFEPFETTSNRKGGLGLGLYLARQIARLHGGEVRFAESRDHRGNVIEAVFPQAS